MNALGPLEPLLEALHIDCSLHDASQDFRRWQAYQMV
jgi:hypothetical protein